MDFSTTFDAMTTDVTALLTSFINDAFVPLMGLGVIIAVLYKSAKRIKKIV